MKSHRDNYTEAPSSLDWPYLFGRIGNSCTSDQLDLFPVVRQLAAPVQAIFDMVPHRICRDRFAVGDEGPSRRRLEMLQPAEDFRIVGMRGKVGKDRNFGAHRHIFPVDLDALRDFQRRYAPDRDACSDEGIEAHNPAVAPDERGPGDRMKHYLKWCDLRTMRQQTSALSLPDG